MQASCLSCLLARLFCHAAHSFDPQPNNRFGITPKDSRGVDVTASKRRCRTAICSRSTRRDDEQRLDQQGQIGEVFDQLLDARLELDCPDHTTLRPKLRKVTRKSFSMAMAFDCSSLRWVSNMRSF
jgi:hypothetical protein